MDVYLIGVGNVAESRGGEMHYLRPTRQLNPELEMLDRYFPFLDSMVEGEGCDVFNWTFVVQGN